LREWFLFLIFIFLKPFLYRGASEATFTVPLR
jgi:hypothetical protein